MSLVQFQGGDQPFQLMQNSWASILDPLIKKSSEIGKLVSAVNASATHLTSGVVANLVSINLTPGDWDIWATGAFAQVTALTANFFDAVMATSPTATLGPDYSGLGIEMPNGPTANAHQYFNIGPYPITVMANITYFLNVQAGFSAGTLDARGALYARRVN